MRVKLRLSFSKLFGFGFLLMRGKLTYYGFLFFSGKLGVSGLLLVRD